MGSENTGLSHRAPLHFLSEAKSALFSLSSHIVYYSQECIAYVIYRKKSTLCMLEHHDVRTATTCKGEGHVPDELAQCYQVEITNGFAFVDLNCLVQFKD